MTITEDRIKALDELGFGWEDSHAQAIRGTYRGTASIQREAWIFCCYSEAG